MKKLIWRVTYLFFKIGSVFSVKSTPGMQNARAFNYEEVKRRAFWTFFVLTLITILLCIK